MEIWGDTKPYRFKSVKSTETTRPLEHWIPAQEQTELGLEEFQVLRMESENSKPFLSLTKTWKSLTKEEAEEEEEEILRREKSVKTMKGTMFVFSEYVQENWVWKYLKQRGEVLSTWAIMDFIEKEGKVRGIWEASSEHGLKESNIFTERVFKYKEEAKPLLFFLLFSFPLPFFERRRLKFC